MATRKLKTANRPSLFFCFFATGYHGEHGRAIDGCPMVWSILRTSSEPILDSGDPFGRPLGRETANLRRNVSSFRDLFQPPNAVGILRNRSKYEGGTMRKITTILMFIALVALALPAFADTLILKSGEKVTGYYQGGTARVIKFQTADGAVKDYDILSVQQIQFGDNGAAAAPAAAPAAASAAAPPSSAPAPSPAPAPAPSSDPRLLPGNQRVTR